MTDETWRGYLDYFFAGNPRFVVIVDTDALISSVDNDLRKGHRSRILRMATAGTARVFAAQHVYEECYRRLPKVASRGPISLAQMIAHFESNYLPRVRFVNPGERAACDLQSKVVAAADPADEPTARLAHLLAPVVVISGDKHLRGPGLAPENWRSVAGSLVDVAHADGSLAGFTAAFTVPPPVTAMAVRAVARRLGVPPLAFAGSLAALIAIWLSDPSRRAELRYRIEPLLNQVGDRALAAHIQGEAGLRAVHAVELSGAAHPTAAQRVAVVLVRAQGPVTLGEVYANLSAGDASSAAPITREEVAKTLRSMTAAVERPDHRWQLGLHLPPERRQSR